MTSTDTGAAPTDTWGDLTARSVPLAYVPQKVVYAPKCSGAGSA